MSKYYYIFVLVQLTSIFTQHHLTEKQKSNRLILNFANPILLVYYMDLTYHKTKIKNLLIMLCITLKKVYNDLDVETQMIRKGGSFTTIITGWPKVEDTSLLASVVRIIIYVTWWIFMTRVTAILTLSIVLTALLSHQYKNLQSYFYSLDDIFQADDAEVNHEEKELKYIEALKIGFKLHSDTLWCTRQCQEICSVLYSGQIIVNVYVLCVVMLQVVNTERTFVNTVTIISTGVATLTSSGFIMWNAGDITFEAALVPTAVFSSGWHHCRGATSARVRRLLITAMIRAQKPVTLQGFGIIAISYKSYISNLRTKLQMANDQARVELCQEYWQHFPVESSFFSPSDAVSVKCFVVTILYFLCFLFLYLIIYLSDGSFTTVITAWPDVEDNSFIANLVRVLNYLVWWALMARVSAASTLIIITSIAISHQYKNLQQYFYSLNDLFETDVQRKHDEVETKYVDALKVGIQLHSNTMWCTRQFQVVCNVVYSGQITITVSALCLLMLQMVGSERTLSNALTIAATMLAVLIATAMIMLNAGDITVEAALVPTAMYSSGWHNCRGATSAKVRRLLVVAMMQGQKFTVLRSFGIVEISYQSYLSIVKSSYSGFSLLY
ncbi:uncharacterized protein LOC123655069 [Melitaea cinxia]|uniref:uncharacterized protein LOC123655069 n=1 Tax=Melitaea cinxia TaxID=113334 RepID=UPI001E270824|nr:uncharacterized protein LOC123655069 [Melitaea cinxia]